jgi:hypothetical protein
VRLIYPGPCDAVEVPALGILAVRGEPTDDLTPSEHTESLLAQGWTEHKPAIVGEPGPELTDLPRGAKVKSAPKES